MEKDFALYKTPFGYLRMTYAGDRIIDWKLLPMSKIME